MQKLTPRTIALALEYHFFKKDGTLLRHLVPTKVQAMLRRRARAKYLIWEAQSYNKWMVAHLNDRRAKYSVELEPGLLSIATPVWDGTPVRYLRLLAESIADQNSGGACEWFVLDNGCSKSEVRRYLDQLAKQFKWVTLHREAKNEGIVGGLRVCLERAKGRYLCTVDSDDLIYPDCLRVVQHWIRESGFPPLLYSDEDKVIGEQRVQPYFKPDFDPVLLLNSAYIAHLGVIERSKALELGAYSDRNAEGSPDWDCFVRFYAAGCDAVHIPEIIYSWRMHPESTADDAGSKPYIHSSQQAVIGRYLETKGLSGTFELKYSPLLPGTADWWIERKHIEPWHDGLICLFHEGLKPERDDWLWEARGLLERFPDAVMVGGWICRNGQVDDGPLMLGFDGGCGCPDKGRPVVDPGYFTQMRKQHSVSAVSSRFAVVREDFYKDAMENGGFPTVPTEDLGPWLGEYAREKGKRIIFSPFLRCDTQTESKSTKLDMSVAADCRYYPRYFGLTPETAYQLRLRQ